MPLDSGCSDEKAFSPTSSKLRPAKVQNKIAAADVASQLRVREPLCRGKGLVDSAESSDACVAEEFLEIGASGSVYGHDDVGRWTALHHQGTAVKAGDAESEGDCGV